MLNQRSDKVELLRIAEAVATEKSIDKEIILSSMETAIQKAAKTKFGSENEIEAQIDRKSGSIKIQKVLTIVDTVEDPAKEILLKDANSGQKKNETLKEKNTKTIKILIWACIVASQNLPKSI